MSEVLRPCIDCGRLSKGTRCELHATLRQRERDRLRGSPSRRGYDRQWQRLAKAIVGDHVRRFGYVCPGYGRRAHPSRALTVDHRVPLVLGGASTAQNAQVLCRSCNSAKGRGGRNLYESRRRIPPEQAVRTAYGSGHRDVSGDAREAVA